MAKTRGGATTTTQPDSVAQLFQLPLDRFTAERNRLAAALKKAGKTDEAARIKTLDKPPISAWVVNQLFWRHRDAFDKLMATGEAFRKAQAAQLAGKPSQLREALEARRAALGQLSRLATSTLAAAHHSASPATMRRITTTLEALATYGEQPNGPQAGMLTGDVDPPGFEALAALVPVDSGAGKRGKPRVIPFTPHESSRKKRLSPEAAQRKLEEEAKARRAAAKQAVIDGERALREARRVAQAAEAALKRAAAAAKETEKARAALAPRYEKAAAAAETAKVEAHRVAKEAEDAAQAVQDAERAVEQAKRAAEEA